MNLYAEVEKTMSYKCNYKNYRDVSLYKLFFLFITFKQD